MEILSTEITGTDANENVITWCFRVKTNRNEKSVFAMFIDKDAKY